MLLIKKHTILLLSIFLSFLSFGSSLFYSLNGWTLLYNDAKSHLDIGRRVVEGLTPGLVQLGGVWLPLPHLLMIPTIWNDFMWHSGLSGALQSMASFVAIGVLIYLFLKKLGVGVVGRIAGVLAFALNGNVLYLQSTAMTELLLLATMLAASYELILWHKEEKLYPLVKAAFWIMLATLIRYDGWFLFGFATLLVLFHTLRRFGWKAVENSIIPFVALGGLGIALWLSWNYLIYKDALYFALGAYSAHEQQLYFEQSGALVTKNNSILSLITYVQAVILNAGWVVALFGMLGMVVLWFDKQIQTSVRIATLILLSPLIFNILALFLGYSVLLIPGITGEQLFNIRYGMMMVPALAIFFGYLVHRLKLFRFVLIGILLLTSFFTLWTQESIVMQDARYGLSGTDVSKISNWLTVNAAKNDGYILVSTASHDQVIFSSGLPLKRFIHQGTGFYWDLAVAHPDRYVRFIIVRTGDESDLVYRMLADNASFRTNYQKVETFPFADVYALKPEKMNMLRSFPRFE